VIFLTQLVMVEMCRAMPSTSNEGWVLDAPGDDGRATLTLRPPVAVNQASAPPAPPPPETDGDEWQVGTGFAWSIDLLQSKGDRRYVPVTVSWARRLISEGGPGFLRGSLSWGVEVMPLYLQTAPNSTTGFGVSPLVWRWRFVPHGAAAPFAELAFGGIFTADPVPEGTRTANFLAHGAFGLRWRPAKRLSLVTAYRFQHISNGNQLASNPGVNAHVAWAGLSLTR
jgi:hypothetical protein